MFKVLFLAIIGLMFSLPMIQAQGASCPTETVANVSTILANVQTLLDEGNIEGANTLIGAARDQLDDCIATELAEPAEQATQETADTESPAPTATPETEPVDTSAEPAPAEVNYTLNIPEVDQSRGIAFIYFAHTSVDAGALDIYMDNNPTPVVANLHYGEVTEIVWVSGGGHAFTARPAGSGTNGEQLYRTDWNYTPNSTWIVLGAGLRDEFAFIVEPISIIRNNYNGQARVRLVNLIAGAPRLTVRTNTGQSLGDGLGWVGVRDTLLDGGTYQLTVEAANNGQVDIATEYEFPATSTTTLLAMGRGTPEEPIRLLTLTAPQDQTRIRFINRGGSPIEILMRPGNQRLVDVLEPGAESEAFVIPSGAATFVSYAPGTGPRGQELAALPHQLRPGRDLLIGINGNRMQIESTDLYRD